MNKLDITNIFKEDIIQEGEVSFQKEKLKDTKLSVFFYHIELYIDVEDEVSFDLTMNGKINDKVVKIEVSEKITNYFPTFSINNENYVDIYELLWQNILLEMPK